jgi:hypothetical protein
MRSLRSLLVPILLAVAIGGSLAAMLALYERAASWTHGDPGSRVRALTVSIPTSSPSR